MNNVKRIENAERHTVNFPALVWDVLAQEACRMDLSASALMVKLVKARFKPELAAARRSTKKARAA